MKLKPEKCSGLNYQIGNLIKFVGDWDELKGSRTNMAVTQSAKVTSRNPFKKLIASYLFGELTRWGKRPAFYQWIAIFEVSSNAKQTAAIIRSKFFFGRSIVNKRSRNLADCLPTGYRSATDRLPTGYRPFAKTKSLLQNRHKWSIIPGQQKLCFKTRKQLAIFLFTSLPIDCWHISYGSWWTILWKLNWICYCVILQTRIWGLMILSINLP